MSVKVTTDVPSSAGHIPCTIEFTLDLTNTNATEKSKDLIHQKMVEVLPKLVAEIARAVNEVEPAPKPTIMQEGVNGLHIVLHDTINDKRTRVALDWNCRLSEVIEQFVKLTGRRVLSSRN